MCSPSNQTQQWCARIVNTHASPSGPSTSDTNSGDTFLAQLDQYINVSGHVRVGKLLEEFDAFAGCVAYKHAQCEEHPPETLTLVTASLDRIDLFGPIPTDKDVLLRGCCTAVGRTSMNIELDLSTVPDHLTPEPEEHDPRATYMPKYDYSKLRGRAGGRPLAHMSFTYVARNLEYKSVEVPQMQPATPEERVWIEKGLDAQLARKAMRRSSLYVLPPSPEELGHVHGMFMDLARRGHDFSPALAGMTSATTSRLLQRERDGAPAPETKEDGPLPVVFMEDTTLRSVLVTMPQDR